VVNIIYSSYHARCFWFYILMTWVQGQKIQHKGEEGRVNRLAQQQYMHAMQEGLANEEDRIKRSMEPVIPTFHGFDCARHQEEEGQATLLGRPEVCQEEGLRPRKRAGKVQEFDLFFAQETVAVSGQFCKRMVSTQAGRCGMQSWYEVVDAWELTRAELLPIVECQNLLDTHSYRTEKDEVFPIKSKGTTSFSYFSFGGIKNNGDGTVDCWGDGGFQPHWNKPGRAKTRGLSYIMEMKDVSIELGTWEGRLDHNSLNIVITNPPEIRGAGIHHQEAHQNGAFVRDYSLVYDGDSVSADRCNLAPLRQGLVLQAVYEDEDKDQLGATKRYNYSLPDEEQLGGRLFANADILIDLIKPFEVKRSCGSRPFYLTSTSHMLASPALDPSLDKTVWSSLEGDTMMNRGRMDMMALHVRHLAQNTSDAFQDLLCASDLKVWRDLQGLHDLRSKKDSARHRFFVAGELIVVARCPRRVYVAVEEQDHDEKGNEVCHEELKVQDRESKQIRYLEPVTRYANRVSNIRPCKLMKRSYFREAGGERKYYYLDQGKLKPVLSRVGRALDAVFTQGIDLKEVLEADNTLRSPEEVAAHLLYSEFHVVVNQAPGPEMEATFDRFRSYTTSHGTATAMPSDWITNFGATLSDAAESVGGILTDGFNYVFGFFSKFWWHLLMAIGSVGGLVFELYLILNFALGGRASCRPHRYGDGDTSVRARFRLGVSQQARTEGRLERNLVGLLDEERIIAAVESVLMNCGETALGTGRGDVELMRGIQGRARRSHDRRTGAAYGPESMELRALSLAEHGRQFDHVLSAKAVASSEMDL